MIRRALALCSVVVYLSLAACSFGESQPDPAQPATNAAPTPPAPVNAKSPPAENDPQRTDWRIPVEPFEVLGSGHPGKADDDFDKPDGVAFTPNGYLLATDARNRRIQVWDVKSGQRLGEFGKRTFGGEIVDIAVAPNGNVFITDQSLNITYAFRPPKPGEVDEDNGKPLKDWEYQFIGTKFGEQGFDKLGGIACDSQSRVYCVDAHKNEVRRYKPDFTLDPTWKFDKMRADGDTYLHGCEGIAINEASGDVLVSSEKDAIIQVFDEATGRYKGRLVGANNDGAGKPSGKKVFFGSVEGLALAGQYLLCVDESAGHIQIFDVAKTTTFNTDLLTYTASGVSRTNGYLGFWGHASNLDYDGDPSIAKKVKNGEIIPGQVNPPGYFCSPDSISAYSDKASGETYIAIADQCNYRLAIYKLSDVLKAAGSPAAGSQQQPVANVFPGSQPAAPSGPPPAAHQHSAPPVAQPARRPSPPPAPLPADNGKKKDKKGKHA